VRFTEVVKDSHRLPVIPIEPSEISSTNPVLGLVLLSKLDGFSGLSTACGSPEPEYLAGLVGLSQELFALKHNLHSFGVFADHIRAVVDNIYKRVKALTNGQNVVSFPLCRGNILRLMFEVYQIRMFGRIILPLNKFFRAVDFVAR